MMNEIFNCDCIELIKSGYLKDKNICIVTDPPFNIGYHYKSYKDNMKNDEYYELLKNVLVTYDVPFVVIHYAEQLHELSIRLGITPQKVVSWVYNSNTAKQHRDIAFYKVKPNFNLVKQPYKNPNDQRIKERIAKGIGGGKIVRLVEYKSSQECKQERIKSSVCNAYRSHEKHNWNIARTLHDI